MSTYNTPAKLGTSPILPIFPLFCVSCSPFFGFDTIQFNQEWESSLSVTSSLAKLQQQVHTVYSIPVSSTKVDPSFVERCSPTEEVK